MTHSVFLKTGRFITSRDLPILRVSSTSAIYLVPSPCESTWSARIRWEYSGINTMSTVYYCCVATQRGLAPLLKSQVWAKVQHPHFSKRDWQGPECREPVASHYNAKIGKDARTTNTQKNNVAQCVASLSQDRRTMDRFYFSVIFSLDVLRLASMLNVHYS